MNLESIKSRWNEVLDQLLQENRVLWLALFDARLSAYSDGKLTLDFQDPEKFASGHDFSVIRKPENIRIVEAVAQNILGTSISITIK